MISIIKMNFTFFFLKLLLENLESHMWLTFPLDNAALDNCGKV